MPAWSSSAESQHHLLGFAPHPHGAQSTLQKPAHEDRSLLGSYFLVQDSLDYFITANGSGKNGQLPILMLIPFP